MRLKVADEPVDDVAIDISLDNHQTSYLTSLIGS